MNEEDDRRVNEALRGATRQHLQRKHEHRQTKQDWENFEHQFRTTRQTVIGPVFEDFAEKMRGEGYPIKIEHGDGRVAEWGESPIFAEFTLPFEGYCGPPGVKVCGSRRTQKVVVLITLGSPFSGNTDKAAEFEVDKFDQAALESILADFMVAMTDKLPGPRGF